MKPNVTDYFAQKTPSAIRSAQIEFSKRSDVIEAINVAVGNVSLPMHPAMQKRLFELDSNQSPFNQGVVKYSSTVGTTDANAAFMHVLKASGIDTHGLYSQITDGGSQAMELIVLGVAGKINHQDRPLLLIDAAYTNYVAMAKRVGRNTISITRHLDDEGYFSLPNAAEIEKIIEIHQPSAIVIIPYDNPTGQLMPQSQLVDIAKLAVKHNLWLISDEAYRELSYEDANVVSVWFLNESIVPGISGRRISIETASKVWNACGLRIGALVTDNQEFHQKAVAENTSNLCSNVIGQYIFAGLLDEPIEQLNTWFQTQREYYSKLMLNLRNQLLEVMPGIIVSRPQAALYAVVDLRNLVSEKFEAADFVNYCASEGKVSLNHQAYTLLTSPMRGFYSVDLMDNPGRTQLRIALVESPDKMKLVPHLLKQLVEQYLENHQS